MRRFLFVLLAISTGCDPEPIETSNPDTTYYRDVRPVLDTYCSRCHTEEGAAPMDLTDPDIAVSLAEVMLGQIDAGTMPPPVSDPECHEYLNSERMQITTEDRDTIARWIELGSPLGDIATLTTVPKLFMQLEEPDLEVRIPKPYTPVFEDTSNPGNEYRCFAIDHGQTEDFYITGLAPVIDNSEMVHHVVIAKVDKSEISEEYQKEEGWSCINGEGPSQISGMVAGWAPGMVPVQFEEGTGMKVSPDDRLIIQMHYYAYGPDAAVDTDQSGYEFTTASSVDTEILMYPFGPTSFRIPAGDDSYSKSSSFTMPSGIQAKAYGSFPHMHNLGAGYHLTIQKSDGTNQCILKSDRWSFENQLTYMFPEPIALEAGDTIKFECTWNNSKSNASRPLEEPVDTRYGERTDEEMCFAFTFLSIGG